MSALEISATALTILCVLLAVKRNTWQYPIGIIGTILFYFVFLNAGLIFSAYLQIFFTFVQIYGWWFWLKGDSGNKPKITKSKPALLLILAMISGAFWYLGGTANEYFNAQLGKFDALIFGLSVCAQFLLDRKKLENWYVWILVN